MELIGEIGTNHNSEFENAIKLIDMAKDSGLDTVKLQIYEPLDIVSPLVKSKLYGYDIEYEFWCDYIENRLITPKEWVKELVSYARELDLDLIATAHSIQDAEFCLKSGIERLKVASMDNTYFSFLEDLSSLDVPILLSTGMANRDEIIKMVETVKKKDVHLTLFHCVSTYPTEYSEMNLSFFSFLNELEIDKMGLSDHSTDNVASLISIAYGVEVIEKHITLDNRLDGPDHKFALDKDACTKWNQDVRNGLLALGNKRKNLSEKELKNKKLYQRAAIAKRDLEVGEKISHDTIFFARPDSVAGNLIDSKNIDQFIGFELKNPIKRGEVLKTEYLR